MKKIILFFLASSFLHFLQAQSVGIGTSAPDASAQLDVVSTDKGVLVPRVALTAANAAAPVTTPATGLLVYNTATAGVAPDNVIPGYYYWNGTRWYPVVNKGTNTGDMQYWDGSKWVMIPAGQQGQALTWCNGKPVWGACSPLTIAPVNNPYEQIMYSLYPTVSSSPYPNILMTAWTSGGSPYNVRTCLKFDVSNISSSAVIDSAFLYLYADPAPQNGNQVDAHSGPANACYIQRITSAWNLPAYFTWSNQPAVTTVNQAIIPQSNSAFEDSKINMTNLVQDIMQYGNNGFFIRLQNEAIYNVRQYVSSSDASFPEKRPKLVVYFH